MGIYKSSDGMQSVGAVRPATGFPAWPASAIGRQIAVGPSIAGRGDVVVAANPAGTDNFGAWRTAGGPFTNNTFTSAQSHAYSKVRTLTSQVWFLFFWADDALNLDDGVCYRTKDGGATWDEPYSVPAAGRVWQDIQRDAGGRLWGLTIETGNSDHMEIWYNDDPEGDGAWTESKDNDSSTSKFPVHIATHPTDQNIIAIWARTGALNRDFTIWSTQNRGATWASNTVANISTGTMVQSVGFKMVSNTNRLVVTHFDLAAGDGEIITSDDLGASWDSRKVFSDVESASEIINGVAGIGSLGKLFVSIMFSPSGGVATNEIWRSTDGGLTWSAIANASLGNAPPQVAASHHYDGGPAYDPVDDALYLFGATDTGGVNGVVRLRPANATGTWQDLTDAIGSYSLALRNAYAIAVIPQ